MLPLGVQLMVTIYLHYYLVQRHDILYIPDNIYARIVLTGSRPDITLICRFLPLPSCETDTRIIPTEMFVLTMLFGIRFLQLSSGVVLVAPWSCIYTSVSQTSGSHSHKNATEIRTF